MKKTNPLIYAENTMLIGVPFLLEPQLGSMALALLIFIASWKLEKMIGK